MKSLSTRVIFTTLAVCALIFLLALFATYFSWNINRQAASIYLHPYTVKSTAQTMRTRLSGMSLHLLPAMLNSGEEHAKDSLRMMDQMDELQDASLGIIQKYYLGDPADIPALGEALAAVRSARRQAVVDCFGIVDSDVILGYLEERVNPHSEAAGAVLQRIMDSADIRVQEFLEASEKMRNIVVFGTIFLCLLLTSLLLSIRAYDQRAKKLITYREHLFSLLAKSVDDVFFINNLTDERLEYVSANSFRTLGIEPQEFYRDRWAMKRGLTPETLAEIEDMLTSVTLDEMKEKNFKFHTDNKVMDLRMRIYPIFAENEPRRIVAVLNDQSRIIAQQTAMGEAILAASEANNVKQEFLSRMSNEIRTPLSVITGMVATATKNLGDRGRVQECLGKIAVSSNYLSYVVKDLLNITKVREGKPKFLHGSFSLRNCMGMLTAIIYPQTIAKRQKFEITISGFSEESLSGDELRLNQVLLNLLSNAVKFTPQDGEIRLEITCLQHEGSGVLLRFVVSDTGTGIDQQLLYMPPGQDDDAAQDNSETGVSLAIVKSLVYAMAGSFSIASREGCGTAVTIELPFNLPGEGEGEGVPLSPELGALSVLVADDDRASCEHAMRLLEQIGVRCDWANSGAGAVEKAAKAREDGPGYTVCLIDWHMPDMDGAETVRRLREQAGADTQIITSSYDQSAIMQEAIEAGTNFFISKPFFASSLYKTLADVSHTLNAPGEPAPQSEAYNFKGRKVLLAEDNALNKKIALKILHAAGLGVDCANDGQQALYMFQSSREGEYALILMDMNMPRMDGCESARSIRAVNHPDARRVPILGMTAKHSSAEMRTAQDAGMNGHIDKPLDEATLLHTIAVHLNTLDLKK